MRKPALAQHRWVLELGLSYRVGTEPNGSANGSSNGRAYERSKRWGLEVVLDEVCEPYCDSWALEKVRLAVGPGEIVALAGPPADGAGALLRMIETFRAPRSGAVRLIGQPALQAIDLGLFRARSIARLGPPSSLLAALSVQGNLEGPLLGAHRDWRERRQRVTAAIERFGLNRLADTVVGALDPHAQARVMLAMALITRPRLLLVDQPRERAAANQILDALELHANTRSGERDPTILIASDPSSERVDVERTIELPYRAIDQGDDERRNPRAMGLPLSIAMRMARYDLRCQTTFRPHT